MSEALEVPFYFCRGILRSDTITFFKYFLSFGETTLKEAWFWGCLSLHINFLFASISVWKQFRGPAQWMMLIGLHGVAKARKSYTIMTLCKHRLGWPGSSTESRDLILFFSESVPNNDYLRNCDQANLGDREAPQILTFLSSIAMPFYLLHQQVGANGDDGGDHDHHYNDGDGD